MNGDVGDLQKGEEDGLTGAPGSSDNGVRGYSILSVSWN